MPEDIPVQPTGEHSQPGPSYIARFLGDTDLTKTTSEERKAVFDKYGSAITELPKNEFLPALEELGFQYLKLTLAQIYEQENELAGRVMAPGRLSQLLLRRAQISALPPAQREVALEELHADEDYSDYLDIKELIEHYDSAGTTVIDAPDHYTFTYHRGGSLRDPRVLNRLDMRIVSVAVEDEGVREYDEDMALDQLFPDGENIDYAYLESVRFAALELEMRGENNELITPQSGGMHLYNAYKSLDYIARRLEPLMELSTEELRTFLSHEAEKREAGESEA